MDFWFNKGAPTFSICKTTPGTNVADFKSDSVTVTFETVDRTIEQMESALELLKEMKKKGIEPFILT